MNTFPVNLWSGDYFSWKLIRIGGNKNGFKEKDTSCYC